MRRLLTVAFPRLDDADAAFIDGFRAEHDATTRARIDAHVTLVFGCAAVPEPAYVAHVRQVGERTAPIAFRCRYAMLGADDEAERAYVFLVPDEGHAALSLLHDHLYTGALADHLRLDLPYTPHITIGSSPDRRHAKGLCDGLNAGGLDMRATIDALSVGSIEGGRFSVLATLPLAR
ncbi:2'-5' RNA ligase family protein [Ideonella sp.]|uniref:2'-5' RNA ligase family protein n=1 Tax=Ideonella sp. TaxID=1929293 RepID=UPI0035B2BB9E